MSVSSMSSYAPPTLRKPPPPQPAEPAVPSHTHSFPDLNLNPKLHSICRHRLLLRPRTIRRFLFLFPLLPLCCIIFLIDFGPPPIPGSVYRTPILFNNLWPHILSDHNSSALIQLSSVWKHAPKIKSYKPCPNFLAALRRNAPAFSGYLIVDANGGLNQQRSAICNAVAVAGLLNAILVIPRFEYHSVWRDTSEFGEIYDLNHFIASLKGYVQIVEKLPEDILELYNGSVSNIRNMRVQAWAPVSYYLEVIYPKLRNRGVIRIAPFANRLAMTVPPHIQHLRCLANYKALRFSHHISELAKRIVGRMARKSRKSEGKYVAIHLRFEEDMVAFSCCLYDEGRTGKAKLELIRERGWGNKFMRKNRIIRPDLNRVEGKCPLSPLEVGLMLRGMGFDNSTSIYLASGNIYNAVKHLSPLRTMFPLIHTKESLTTPDELASFKGYSSRLAALDYMVALRSEVFVTTQGGNFPQFLMGHRRFIHDGHAKTIKPDKQKLVLTFDNTGIRYDGNHNWRILILRTEGRLNVKFNFICSWTDFKNQMEAMLVESDLQGSLLPKTVKPSKSASIYSYPFPDCRCLLKSQNSTSKLKKPTLLH